MGEKYATFRGVRLPNGMTPELALKIEAMIVRYVDAANGTEDDGPIELPFQFGITLFREISGNLRSS